MPINSRRFLLWPRDNLTGRSRPAAVAEGVLFSDGSVALRYCGAVPTCVVYPDHGVDAILAGIGFGGQSDIEWLDW